MLRYKFLYPFFFPGGLFLAVGLLLLRSAPLPQFVIPFLPLLFPFVFTITMLLGFRFKRNRLIFALLLLALALGSRWLSLETPKIHAILAMLLPLNLALTLLLPEKKLRNPITALYGSCVLIQGLTVLWLAQFRPENFFVTLNRPFSWHLPLSVQPGILQLAALGIALLLAISCFQRRPQPFEAAFFWAILLTVIPFHLHLGRQSTQLFFSLAVLALLTGLLETSHSMVYRDELTDIPGRRALNETLKRLGACYAVAMIDIDHFKKFNDKHGHEVGDQVLKMVAGRLAKVGDSGRAFRYGGEEFAIVFSGRTVEHVLPELEKLRQNVASAGFIPRGKDRPEKKPKNQTTKKTAAKPLRVTISIGVAEPSLKQRAPEQVMIYADQALYRAKQQGRNRVCS